MTLATRQTETHLVGASAEIQDMEIRFAVAVRQRELLEIYIRERLKPGHHFYKVRDGSKNSLTKEGAELVCLSHGYRPMYYKESGPDAPPEDNSPFQLTVRCRLMRGDVFAGEGMGSASSWHTNREGERMARFRDPGLCHNATLKMAQKSAYIAATLNATAASEFFTQDLEDAQGEMVDDARPPAPKDNRYWCTEHKTEWFKKGKMRGYAHRIGDTEKWCNMKDAPVSTAADRSDDADIAEHAPEPTSTPVDFEARKGAAVAIIEGEYNISLDEAAHAAGLKSWADVDSNQALSAVSKALAALYKGVRG